MTISANRLARVLAPALTVAERAARETEAREWTGAHFEFSFALDDRCAIVRDAIRRGDRPAFGKRGA